MYSLLRFSLVDLDVGVTTRTSFHESVRMFPLEMLSAEPQLPDK